MVTEAEVVAVVVAVDAAATKAATNNKRSQRKNQSLISANTWKRRYEYDLMEDEKVTGRSCCLYIVTISQPIALCTVVGKLMGYDGLLNLVLDDTIEYLKGKRIKKGI